MQQMKCGRLHTATDHISNTIFSLFYYFLAFKLADAR